VPPRLRRRFLAQGDCGADQPGTEFALLGFTQPGHHAFLEGDRAAVSFGQHLPRRGVRYTRRRRLSRGVVTPFDEAIGFEVNQHLVGDHAGLSEEQFASATHRTGPDWQVRHVAEAELYSLTGAAYGELARHQPRYAGEAIRRLNRALELRGIGGARNATLDAISLAEAHLADHDLSQALHATGQANQLAQDSASRRVRKRLNEPRLWLICRELCG
jgi:hypothetical protein